MSDEESVTVETSEAQMLTAEYKDGRLQIVEVTPFDKKETHILPDLAPGSSEGHKYMQLVDTNKGLVQLDLLNLTLVRCEDGDESYRLVANTDSDSADVPSDATVTCVLQSSDDGDGEDQDNQESYVMVEGSEQGPLVFLQSSVQQSNHQPKEDAQKKPLTPTEILERAKALQKARALMSRNQTISMGKRGRKRKGELPPPHELLSSPNFKLFLYSCKQCLFKCNAVKELSEHRAQEHSSGASKYRTGGSSGRASSITLQCARCPFRGGTHSQLMKHVQDKHLSQENATIGNKVSLDTKEVEAADVLVCGACGFESSSRHEFKVHIEDEHGATTS